MENYFILIIIPLCTSITLAEEDWKVEVNHDPAGGVFRVSGDGPKSRIANPVLDIGSAAGKEAFLTFDQVQSHPNYKYLPTLSECGLVVRSKSLQKIGTLLDFEDYDENADLLGGLNDTGIDSKSEEEQQRVKRIVGGKPVKIRKHPWMVQLYMVHDSTGRHLFHCAGTLISNSTILTAAHCITRIQPGNTLQIVVVGIEDRRTVKFCKTLDLAENCSRKYIKAIGGFQVYRNYSEGNLHHDIGLVYLKKPLQFSDKVRPICLPYYKNVLKSWPSLKITAVGWGSMNKYIDGYNSALLKEVEVDLQSRSTCDQFHKRIYGRTLDDRICTAGHNDRATCNGDSGGGIVKCLKIPDPVIGNDTDERMKTVERVFQFGIVSAGGHITDTCGFQGRPAIDTNVIYYMEWILNHIVHGAQSYYFVDENDSPINSSLWQKVSSQTVNESVNPYKNEFSTGENVDVSQHPNIRVLPSFSNCGMMMPTKMENNATSSSKLRDDPPQPQPDPSIVSKEEDMPRIKRIVGGLPTSVEGYLPWMAQVYTRNVENNQQYFRCGGTIISVRHILTAASCVTELPVPFVLDSIVVGQYNRNSSEECVDDICYQFQEVKVADIIIHSEFEKYTQRNNLAIVRLSEDLEFTRMIQPICLPRREILLDGIRVHKYFTAGWGSVTREGKESNRLSEILLQTNVKLRPRRDCDFVYSRAIDLLGRSRLCGGGNAAKGECIGDSGSALMKQLETENGHLLNNRIFQLGIVTFNDCGMEGMPTVYMNVLSYMNWILDNLGNPDESFIL